MMHIEKESGTQSAMEESGGIDDGGAAVSRDDSICSQLQSENSRQPLNPATLDTCHRSKRWKELRVMMAMRKKAAMASNLNSSVKSPIKTLTSTSFVVYENQCVVDITSPASAVTVSAAAPLLAPVLKRRCSLTMPYPALYGSWQAQTLSIAKASISVTAPAASTTDKTDKIRNAEAALTTSHKLTKPPLLRRWSTQQMDVQQMKPKQQIRPLSPCLIGRPIQHHTIAESENETNVDVDVSTPGRSQRIFSLSQDPVLSHSSPLSIPLLASTNPQENVTPLSGIEGAESGCISNGQDSSKNRLDPTSPSLTCALVNECINDGSVPMLQMCPSIPLMTDPDADSYSDHPHLITCTLQRLPLKDFGAEVRPAVDITQFLLQQSVLLLDVIENSPEDLVDLLLRNMVPNVASEAKSILFTHDSVPMLARTIQATCTNDSGTFDYDQSWICALCNLPTLQRRHVGIARLKHPANMGHTCHEVRLFVLVLCPSKEKGTKNALETGRTFATLLADIDLRQRLLEARSEDEFKRILLKHTHELAEEQAAPNVRVDAGSPMRLSTDAENNEEKFCRFGQGIREDLSRRLPHYASDYKDGIVGVKTPQKVLSTTLFLYFACILPAIAFGVLNDHNTHGKIDVKKVIIGQTIGGLFYVIFGGQPLLILLTTAPLSLYIKVIYSICEDFDLDFYAMYCCVGLWAAFFLILYSLFDVSRLMRWSTRSTEEIFALFISIAFCVDAYRDTVKNFNENYNTPLCNSDASTNESSDLAASAAAFFLTSNTTTFYGTTNSTTDCNRASSLLFLLLMFGTVWIGVSLYNFNKTPYLQAGKREALADYSLPVAVITLSFVGSYIFQDVTVERFRYDDKDVFTVAPLERLSLLAVLGAMGLGFSLSLLFFMDQNITSAMVNNPCNKLKKGPAYHLDLFVVGILNAFLSIFGLPWMHATLPHSPLHVRGLADVEERVDQGHVYEIIVKVRETRLTGMMSHVFIGLSLFLLPYPLAYIPTAVLDGLFLYMAVTALNGNQMFERITLLFMEQAAYPPNHYIRRVPQRKIHQFTGCQVLQLLVMCLFGFAPWAYMKMVFPLIILFLLPVRHRLVPKLIEARFLEALDGEHQ